MIFHDTKIAGAFVIDLQPIADDRGFFSRSFCKEQFERKGIAFDVQQANVSFNKKKGTLRGMHMQVAPFSEAKLVRCTRGSIFDVVLDLRAHSETYLQWTAVELTSDNYKMFLIPEGCAHGYLTLEDNTEVTYQVNQSYHPGAERGYRWDDTAFNIQWPFKPMLISEKDKTHPFFEQTENIKIGNL